MLVHQDHLRARHECAADREHLLLAAGEMTSEYWASHFVALELRREAETPPPLLPNFSYASANRRSRRATYPAVCSKRATLLGNANGPTACAGTERDNGMLGRQLFGPGGDYHSRTLDRWAANPGRREGAIADSERRPLILRSSFSCAQSTGDGFSGAQNEHRPRQLGSRLCARSAGRSAPMRD